MREDFQSAIVALIMLFCSFSDNCYSDRWLAHNVLWLWPDVEVGSSFANHWPFKRSIPCPLPRGACYALLCAKEWWRPYHNRWKLHAQNSPHERTAYRSIRRGRKWVSHFRGSISTTRKQTDQSLSIGID